MLNIVLLLSAFYLKWQETKMRAALNCRRLLIKGRVGKFTSLRYVGWYRLRSPSQCADSMSAGIEELCKTFCVDFFLLHANSG